MQPLGLHQGFVNDFEFLQGKSFRQVSREAMCSSVLPPHKATGKINYKAIENDQQKNEPSARHFEYLQNFGEVQAT